MEGLGLIYSSEFCWRRISSPLFGSGSILIFILISAFHSCPSDDGFLIFLLAVLTVYVRELTFSFGNSASSKPPLTTGHHSYGPSGDASGPWAKMAVSLPRFSSCLLFFFQTSSFCFCKYSLSSRHTLLLRSYLSVSGILPPLLPLSPSLKSVLRGQRSSEHLMCSNSFALHSISLWQLL